MEKMNSDFLLARTVSLDVQFSVDVEPNSFVLGQQELIWGIMAESLNLNEIVCNESIQQINTNFSMFTCLSPGETFTSCFSKITSSPSLHTACELTKYFD